MRWVALIGPEVEQNVSMRSLASSLAYAGYASGMVGFEGEHDIGSALHAIMNRNVQPAAVSLAGCQAPASLALARALREHGYAGQIVASELAALLDALETPAECLGHAIAPLPDCTRDADELGADLLQLQGRRGIDIFVLRDERWFGSGKRRDLARVRALAAALERCGVRRFASVVRVRPEHVERELLQLLRDRLHVLRVDLCIRSPHGYRGSKPRCAERAIDLLRELDLYCCLQLQAIEPHLALLRAASDFPFQLEHADRLATGVVRDQLHERIRTACFELEVCRHFHPSRYERAWRAEALALTRALGEDSVFAFESSLQYLTRHAPGADDARFAAELARSLLPPQTQLGAAAAELSARIAGALGPRPANVRVNAMRALDASALQ